MTPEPPDHQVGAESASGSLPEPSYVRLWGTRGSVPTPGPGTVRYGGNTTCVEVVMGGERLVLDAGTGLRLLGEDLEKEGASGQAQILLTHFHWDHIQGLPFFSPAYGEGFDLQIHGPRQEGTSIRGLLGNLFHPSHFPFSPEEFPADITLSEVDEGSWPLGGLEVKAMRVRHQSNTLGYRIESEDRSIVFIPDNELEGGPFPTPAGWREALVDFVKGADVLLHDAMFTAREAPRYRGWGHSTYEETLELAMEAEVRRLAFFHHAPIRVDDELDELVERYAGVAASRGADLIVGAAVEGGEIPV